MKKHLFIISMLICLLFSNCTEDPKEEDPLNPEDVQALIDTLTTFQKTSEIPGFAINVVKEGELVFQEAFGNANEAYNIAYTNQSIQPIGSVSKTFIGLALMKAIELDYFTLETAINDILPFEVNNPFVPNKAIRIKQLVRHSSGLVDTDLAYYDQYYIREGEDLSTPVVQELLSLGAKVGSTMELGDFMEAIFTPEGEFYSEELFNPAGPDVEYEYSNLGASLAAYLVEVKAGKPFHAFVKEHILDPLGMNNTGYDRQSLNSLRLATLYLSKDYPFMEYVHSSYPDGFLNSSNEDMGRFLVEMMKGKAGNGTLISKESYEILFERKSEDDLPDGDIHAVFWDLADGRIEHSGGDPGVLAFTSFDPINNTGYSIQTNINEDGLGAEFGVDGAIQFEQLFHILDLIEAFEGTF